LKVSYNIGADTSLLLFGLTQGVNNMGDALVVERNNLISNYGIPGDEFEFVDGSGDGFTTATNGAVTKMLLDMAAKPAFPSFLAAQPILGVDGSLAFVTDFQSDSTLAGATGQVRAKTGTFVQGTASGIVLKAQALGGYIKTNSGRQLAYELVVNDVAITGLNDVIQVFQDEGTISAILWRDN
jgi:D-alanyl-D-alanine carboxypeptidase